MALFAHRSIFEMSFWSGKSTAGAGAMVWYCWKSGVIFVLLNVLATHAPQNVETIHACFEIIASSILSRQLTANIHFQIYRRRTDLWAGRQTLGH